MNNTKKHNDIFSVDTLEKKTLSKQIADKILELLKERKLNPGDRLPPELELIDMLSVSRSALREAMSSLESLGIIHRRTKGGTFFSEKIGSKPFSNMLCLAVDDLPAIIEARMALELGLVMLAAEKITDKQLEKLKQTIDQISHSNGNYADIDKEFHSIIAHSAANGVVEGMIDSLLVAFDEMSRHIQIRERNVAVEHHTAIYEALAKHSPSEASMHMYRHLDFVRQKILNSRND